MYRDTYKAQLPSCPVAQLPSEMQWKLREEKNPHISKSSWNNNNRKINTTKNTNRLTLQFLHTHSICSSLTHHDIASRRKKETANEIKEKKQPEIYIVCGKKRSVIARALIMCAREMLKMRNWRVAIDCSSLGFFFCVRLSVKWVWLAIWFTVMVFFSLAQNCVILFRGIFTYSHSFGQAASITCIMVLFMMQQWWRWPSMDDGDCEEEKKIIQKLIDFHLVIPLLKTIAADEVLIVGNNRNECSIPEYFHFDHFNLYVLHITFHLILDAYQAIYEIGWNTVLLTFTLHFYRNLFDILI